MVAVRELRLVHWSRHPIEVVKSCEQSSGRRNDKPKGLWVSDENAEESWSRWCEDEQMGWLHENVYEVTVWPDANVLVVDSELDLFRFDEEYSVEAPYPYCRGGINWLEVAEEYDGIIISPYQWGQRLGSIEWYYGWDCASGCIWNGDSVQSFIELDE